MSRFHNAPVSSTGSSNKCRCESRCQDTSTKLGGFKRRANTAQVLVVLSYWYCCLYCLEHPHRPRHILHPSHLNSLIYVTAFQPSLTRSSLKHPLTLTLSRSSQSNLSSQSKLSKQTAQRALPTNHPLGNAFISRHNMNVFPATCNNSISRAVHSSSTAAAHPLALAATHHARDTQDTRDSHDTDNMLEITSSYQHMQYFQEYQTAMNQVLTSYRIMQKKDKLEDLQVAKQYLLSSTPYLQTHHCFQLTATPTSNTVTTSATAESSSNQTIHDEKQAFVKCIEHQRHLFNNYNNTSTDQHTQHEANPSNPSNVITQKQNEMIARSLTYIGDFCAKHQQYKPLIIAWQKIMECGIKPRINLLSTYLYRLSSASAGASDVVSDSASNGESTNDKAKDKSHDQHSIVDVIVNQVAFYHDMLYLPTENTVAIRIKSSIDKRQPQLAEELLWSLHPSSSPSPSAPSDSTSTTSSSPLDSTSTTKSKPNPKPSSNNNPNSLRLRTCSPILEYYCNNNQMANAIHLYHKIKNIPTVYFDKETYTMIISSCASNGYFCHYSQPIEGAADLGYGPGYGSELFDHLAQDMSNDILELCDQCVNQIRNAFVIGFRDRFTLNNNVNSNVNSNESKEQDESHINQYAHMIRNLDKIPFDCHLSSVQTPAENDEIVLNRVTIDDATSTCPRTNAKLRLIMLDDTQKKHMHDTLLRMADLQFVAYDAKLEAKGQKKSSKQKGNKNSNGEIMDENYAGKHLESFANWLDTREGKPFTVIVDGANVAYFGLGSINYHQIQLMLDALEKMGESPLVVMPQKYTQKKFYLRQGYVQELTQAQLDILDNLTTNGKLYEVPHRCLDDYYWMLSSVSNQTVSSDGSDIKVSSSDGGRWPGIRPILVTNDQMRDHKLELIEPRLFRRWFSSHIVNYEFTPFVNDIAEEREITFVKADSFSREIQQNPSLSDSMNDRAIAWHFPVEGWNQSDRFCVRIPTI